MQKAIKRYGKPQSLDRLVSQCVEPGVQRYGFARAEIISHWRRIVGPDLAAFCQPVKLRFPPNHAGGGTLYLRVAPGHAPQVQHRLPDILAQINRYFGYGAVQKAKLEQGPLPAAQHGALRPVAEKTASAEAQALAEKSTDRVQDPALQTALRRLGTEILGN